VNESHPNLIQNQILWANGKTYWPVLELPTANKKEIANPRTKRVVEEAPVVKIYPSPANSFITVELLQLTKSEDLRMSIINATGIEVFQSIYNTDDTSMFNIPTNNFATGHYFVLIYQGKTIVQKQAIEIIH
jgi:hypothetical protein